LKSHEGVYFGAPDWLLY